MAGLSLGPVSVGIFTLLNVSSLTSLATVKEDIPQGTAFPFVWYEVDEEENRGLGAGGFPMVTLRVHAHSVYKGWKEAQAIIKQVITLLKDQALTVTGYTHAGKIFYDRTVALSDQEINGVKSRELVAFFYTWVEEA